MLLVRRLPKIYPAVFEYAYGSRLVYSAHIEHGPIERHADVEVIANLLGALHWMIVVDAPRAADRGIAV